MSKRKHSLPVRIVAPRRNREGKSDRQRIEERRSYLQVLHVAIPSFLYPLLLLIYTEVFPSSTVAVAWAVYIVLSTLWLGVTLFLEYTDKRRSKYKQEDQAKLLRRIIRSEVTSLLGGTSCRSGSKGNLSVGPDSSSSPL